MDDTMKKHNTLEKNNEAVVGVVAAVLIIALFITIFSIIQTVNVPQWMEQKESEHLNEVTNQFSKLKYALDIQVSTTTSSELSIATPITLGSENIPFFLSQQSQGTLEIVSNEINMTIQGDTTSYIPLGSIKYTSKNSYFVDQSLIYEAGAVIINQDVGNMLYSRPFFSIDNSTMVNISFTIVNISSSGDKTYATGKSTCQILTSYESQTNTTLTNTSIITIDTQYPYPWIQYINSTLSDEGLIYNSDFTISESKNTFSIDFSGCPKNINLDLTVIKISAQIAPGWIE
jgi:hypothetical protein